MKALSCGILVFNPSSELLLCHATGTFVWDIPKGGGEPGETPLQTALRLLPRLSVRDLSRLARDRNINPVVRRRALEFHSRRR